MDAVTALELLGGTARTCDLVPLCGRRALQHALDAGLVVRVARGRFVLPGSGRAVTAAVAAPGVLAGVSAAHAHGWRTLHRRDDAVVAVLPGQRVTPVQGVTYRRRGLSADERRAGRTGPLATVLECAASLPFVDALAVADAALRDGSVLREELEDAASVFHGHGAADVRRVARHADARAANAFESGLRGHLLLAGVRGLVPQHVVTGPGFFAQVDLADPARRVAIEADGFEVHGRRAQLAADLQRHDELLVLGWVTLRFAWEHVMYRPRWVVEQVTSVLDRRRAVGGRTDERRKKGSRRDDAA
ncbi:DUF559 domain-containing protein [Jannaschia sp. R86511]|uniref:DUF559 domain-containing protein n=1 Tax=Jannaschia sp. R86511 TaxID=3093853 RepID=UPI0036D3B3F8